jgi:hypothetical protein
MRRYLDREVRLLSGALMHAVIRRLPVITSITVGGNTWNGPNRIVWSTQCMVSDQMGSTPTAGTR